MVFSFVINQKRRSKERRSKAFIVYEEIPSFMDFYFIVTTVVFTSCLTGALVVTVDLP